ncbi:MAG: hypothetical protein JXR49_21080 [Acidobacteria bacterium]|nr:hypothetical protein [Acidobacteriota bacterium]
MDPNMFTPCVKIICTAIDKPIGVTVEIGKRKEAAITIAIPIPTPTPTLMMLAKLL